MGKECVIRVIDIFSQLIVLFDLEKNEFNGNEELRSSPIPLNGEDVLQQEQSTGVNNFKASLWKGLRIFFELSY